MGSVAPIRTPAGTTFSDTGLTNGTSYTFTVSATKPAVLGTRSGSGGS